MWSTKPEIFIICPSGHMQKKFADHRYEDVSTASGFSSAYLTIPSPKVYFIIFCTSVSFATK